MIKKKDNNQKNGNKKKDTKINTMTKSKIN